MNSLNWRVSVQVAKMTELGRCFDKLKPIAICSLLSILRSYYNSRKKLESRVTIIKYVFPNGGILVLSFD